MVTSDQPLGWVSAPFIYGKQVADKFYAGNLFFTKVVSESTVRWLMDSNEEGRGKVQPIPCPFWRSPQLALSSGCGVWRECRRTRMVQGSLLPKPFPTFRVGIRVSPGQLHPLALLLGKRRSSSVRFSLCNLVTAENQIELLIPSSWKIRFSRSFQEESINNIAYCIFFVKNILENNYSPFISS